MEHSAFYWLVLNLISTIFLAFYSMLEMACVSFNKVRLQYYVSKGYKRAIWLNYLLQHPSRLFGTTLIGVNIALVIGSECSREFYSALGLSPDLAPLTQVILVVIFGELAPMFAARHYAEHVTMLGMPLIYASAKLMTPFLWILGAISKLSNVFFEGSESEKNIYLSQEELLKILEEQGEESSPDSESAEFSAIATNIFSLRGKTARQIMEPLKQSAALPSNATTAEMEAILNKTGAEFVVIFHQEISNVVGIAYPSNALRSSNTRRVREFALPPWFVTETAPIMQILRQFRSNNESVAIILNQKGKAIGLVTLNDLLEEIFGTLSFAAEQALDRQHKKKLMIIEKTLPGDMTVEEFNAQFGAMLGQDPTLTLTELMTAHLGRRPDKGDSIYIAPFEFTVKETSMLDVKTLSVSTRRA